MTPEPAAVIAIPADKLPELCNEINMLIDHYDAWRLETSKPAPPAFGETFPNITRVLATIETLHIKRERKIYQNAVDQSKDSRHRRP